MKVRTDVLEHCQIGVMSSHLARCCSPQCIDPDQLSIQATVALSAVKSRPGGLENSSLKFLLWRWKAQIFNVDNLFEQRHTLSVLAISQVASPSAPTA